MNLMSIVEYSINQTLAFSVLAFRCLLVNSINHGIVNVYTKLFCMHVYVFYWIYFTILCFSCL